jgi:hypothetical protein
LSSAPAAEKVTATTMNTALKPRTNKSAPSTSRPRLRCSRVTPERPVT